MGDRRNFQARRPRENTVTPVANCVGVPISRREAMCRGLAGAAGVLLAGREAAGAKPAKAKSVIQIWAAGGPPHLDTFDPKPEAGNDYCGPLIKPIATKVDGMRIGQLLPLLAEQADKFSIIRSMTHGINAHETASYMVQTGRMPGRLVYPCVCAVVALFKGYGKVYKCLVPPYIVLTTPQGRFSDWITFPSPPRDRIEETTLEKVQSRGPLRAASFVFMK